MFRPRTARRVAFGRQLALLGCFALVVVSAGCTLGLGGLPAPPCNNDTDCEANEVCQAGRCVASMEDGGGMDAGIRDAGPEPEDAGPGPDDAGPPLDGGPPDAGPPPAHCMDMIRNNGETAIDCGGPCPGCPLCEVCMTGADCAGGNCRGGMCRQELTQVMNDVQRRDAYVSPDGRILLAYYAPGANNDAYDVGSVQRFDVAGSQAVPGGWAPDPCTDSGHLPFTEWTPAARNVRIECGTSRRDIQESIVSSTLFSSFSPGQNPNRMGTGSPGYSALASIGDGMGSGSHAMCGISPNTNVGGIAYCAADGGGSPTWARHRASFSADSAGNGYVGCGGDGCQGPLCDLAIWVWLEP